MIDLLGIPDNKIIVAPGGVDKSIFYPRNSENIDEICKKYGLIQPYVLFMDPGNPRKNAITLLKAWDVLKNQKLNLSLVFIGEKFRMGEKTKNTFYPRRIRYIQYVSDIDLARLMSGAAVFVYISNYEGFGLSVLEAMSCGTPVIASNIEGLKESVGDCGYLLDPQDVDELIHGIDLVLTDFEYRNELIHKGFNRAAQFGWESTAEIIESAIWNH
jgi:glycosyltransferase involved in cell wall biosynthesis